MGCMGSKEGVKGPATNGNKPGPKKVGNGVKPTVVKGREQYLDQWMEPAKYDMATVKLSEGNQVAKGTQDDDYAVVNRPVDLKTGSQYNFEVTKTNSKDFGVGIVSMKAVKDREGQEWMPTKMWQFFF